MNREVRGLNVIKCYMHSGEKSGMSGVGAELKRNKLVESLTNKKLWSLGSAPYKDL